MVFLSLLPCALCFWLLAAHFYHDPNRILALVLLSALMPALLLLRLRYVLRSLQVLLIIASAEWVRTTFQLAQERIASGQPFIRLVAILGGVALFNLLAALLFETRRLQACYPRASDVPPKQHP